MGFEYALFFAVAAIAVYFFAPATVPPIAILVSVACAAICVVCVLFLVWRYKNKL